MTRMSFMRQFISGFTSVLLLLVISIGLIHAQDSSADTPADERSTAEDDSPTYVLSESESTGRAYSITYALEVSGQVEERIPNNETRKFEIKSKAGLNYADRHLPSAGRNEAALRALRYFDKHQTSVTIGDRETDLILPARDRLFVVEGRDFELLYYPPSALLSANVLEQLRIPFDSLASLGLLPKTSVKVGGTWKPETWALQLVTGVEAVLKQDCTCTLTKVVGNSALVDFKGSIEGGRFGASTKVEFEGQFEFDLEGKYLRDLTVTQKEKSSISPVSPGLDVAANIHFTRKPIESHKELTDARVAAVPLDPDPIRLLLSYVSPWNARLLHTRNWHVIPGKYVILRLIDNGSLITQGTMMGLPQAAPGDHIPEAKFQKDIEKSLGDKLKEVVSAEEIVTEDGRFLYRVTATGTSNEREMTWIYYLCAHPDGRQVSFVFSTETALLETLKERDVDLIQTVQWPQAETPAKAVSQ